MKIRNIFSIALVGASLLFSACEKDESSGPKLPFDLTQGMIITNEGNFGSANASISIYHAAGDSITSDVFFKANNRVLGDALQSMTFTTNNAYFVLNGSSKIEVVEKSSCKEVATIENLGGPRYMVTYGTKGYVSTWDNNEVVVIDLNSNAVTKKISVGSGPEGLVVVGSKLFVANSGGWGSAKTVSVIDLKTDAVVETINVADSPRGFVVDKNNDVWVLCVGAVDWLNSANTTTSALCKINPTTYNVTTINISTTYHPTQLRTNNAGDQLYYGAGYGVQGIFKMSINGTIPTAPFIDVEVYGFAIDPASGVVYGMQAPSFTAAGKMLRYDLAGKLVKEYTVGIGPNNGYFVR
ncbi:DUF5074 domain-containing protein [Williamwhitmania taraxaci]|uniref:40-residue YVTN family beta-propeller repeat-containing protein n=1 Tax=Williamwhitmania taraxaci TaxID=1640674 RepID=A0A1G6J3B2_9BACT|nr:DUF5074 domain-containing protein [Williamwhitmania taraxaci]SDC13211.1 40-residue YVTN family beta-propeller repeat-containing protein [Williamwhitmania taraxaci]